MIDKSNIAKEEDLINKIFTLEMKIIRQESKICELQLEIDLQRSVFKSFKEHALYFVRT
jgi:hypothetical protein